MAPGRVGVARAPWLAGVRQLFCRRRRRRPAACSRTAATFSRRRQLLARARVAPGAQGHKSAADRCQQQRREQRMTGNQGRNEERSREYSRRHERAVTRLRAGVCRRISRCGGGRARGRRGTLAGDHGHPLLASRALARPSKLPPALTTSNRRTRCPSRGCTHNATERANAEHVVTIVGGAAYPTAAGSSRHGPAPVNFGMLGRARFSGGSRVCLVELRNGPEGELRLPRHAGVGRTGSFPLRLSGATNVMTKVASTPASSKIASVSTSSRACSASSRS